MAGNIAKRPDGSWRARHRDEQGRERSRHFDRKIDAQRWLNEIASTVLTGTYVDPDAGKVTFREFYERWSARQLWVSSTRTNADLATRWVPFADLVDAILAGDVTDGPVVQAVLAVQVRRDREAVRG